MTTLRASMGSVALEFPGDPMLLESAGKVALAHGQLELMLRMTLKTLTGQNVQDALDATADSKNWELRKDIAKLFRQKTKDITLQYRLRALLGRCAELSDKRNRLLHNAWAIASDGSVVTKGDRHAWGKAPTAVELNKLAADIKECVESLNTERLHGFICEVCRQANGRISS